MNDEPENDYLEKLSGKDPQFATRAWRIMVTVACISLVLIILSGVAGWIIRF